MRALICREHGEPEVLALENVPAPKLLPGTVRVRVRAAGVNFADLLMLRGTYQEKPEFPFIPGLEAAGEVIEVNDDVTDLAVGQSVVVLPPNGAFAEEVVVPAHRAFVLPDKLDPLVAAGFPITYGTAHGSLVWRAALKPGETVAVHGAAGGVGLASVEVARALGGRVIASARGAEKLSLARSHGADAVIDYSTEDLKLRLKELTNGRGVDVVLDPVGGDVFSASLRAIAFEGRIVTLGFAGGEVPQIPANHLLVKNVSVSGLYWGAYLELDPERVRKQFDDLMRWWGEGKLTPHIGGTVLLKDGASALRQLAERKAQGKLVIEVAN